VSLGSYLLDYFKTQMGDSPYDVIGPDNGSSYLVREHGNRRMQKERGEYDADPAVRHRSVTKMKHDHIEIQSNAVVIIDDMISTGGTLLRAVSGLHDHGVRDIYCIAVHGLFLNGCYEKLSIQTKAVIVSDTLQHKNSVDVMAKARSQEIEPRWLESCTKRSKGQTLSALSS